MVAEFAVRRRLLVDGLRRIPGFTCAMTAGAFYAFPEVIGTGLDGRTMADRLLQEAGVSTVAGSANVPGGRTAVPELIVVYRPRSQRRGVRPAAASTSPTLAP